MVSRFCNKKRENLFRPLQIVRQFESSPPLGREEIAPPFRANTKRHLFLCFSFSPERQQVAGQLSSNFEKCLCASLARERETNVKVWPTTMCVFSLPFGWPAGRPDFGHSNAAFSLELKNRSAVDVVGRPAGRGRIAKFVGIALLSARRQWSTTFWQADQFHPCHFRCFLP